MEQKPAKTKRQKKDKAILKPNRRGFFGKVIFNQSFLTLLLIIIQLAAIILGLVYLVDKYVYIVITLNLALSVFLIFVILRRPADLSYKIAWIVCVALLPIFGSLLYLWVRIFPNTKVIVRRYTKRIEENKNVIGQNEEVLTKYNASFPSLAGVASAIYDATGSPIYEKQKLTHYKVGDEAFPEMLEALENAKEFIFMEYFIIAGGRMYNTILEILRRKVAEGVEVRMLYDGLNILTTVPRNYHKHLRKAGINVRVFAPLSSSLSPYQNNRDHRKLLIVDGKVGFTGGINLADEYINEYERFGHWKDTVLKLEGEAVNSFTAMFLEMWHTLDTLQNQKIETEKYLRFSDIQEEHLNYIVSYTDLPDNKMALSERLFVSQIAHAHNYVHVFTPYLIMSETLKKELIFAVKRGVEVIILMPHIPDKKMPFWTARSYYKDLLSEGIEIYEYTPGFMHAKATITDDQFVNTGSTNYDFRSLFLNYENGVFISDTVYTKTIEADFQECLSVSQKITFEVISKFPGWQKLLGYIGRIFGTLF